MRRSNNSTVRLLLSCHLERSRLVGKEPRDLGPTAFGKMKNKKYFVYILTNYSNTTLYIGVTSALRRRVYQHKHKLVDGFTREYNLWKLVYYEIFEDVENAIRREKQIKRWSRKKKEDLIERKNSDWEELKPWKEEKD